MNGGYYPRLITIEVYRDDQGYWAQADFGKKHGSQRHGPFPTLVETMTHLAEFMAVAANDARALGA